MPRTWTDAQKQAQRQRMQDYLQTHPHPRLGKSHSEESKRTMRKPKKKKSKLGNCLLCGRPLYSVRSAQRGMGDACAGHIKNT